LTGHTVSQPGIEQVLNGLALTGLTLGFSDCRSDGGLRFDLGCLAGGGWVNAFADCSTYVITFSTNLS
tara:strand:+ start:47943 stop:48146 length:204 start_codon:yes stop_codon:yes gene_type:complete